MGEGKSFLHERLRRIFNYIHVGDKTESGDEYTATITRRVGTWAGRNITGGTAFTTPRAPQNGDVPGDIGCNYRLSAILSPLQLRQRIEGLVVYGLHSIPFT